MSEARRDGLRVLHVQKAKGIGGSERHLLALLPALAARGVDVRFCVLHEAGGERFVEALEAVGVPVTSVPAGPDVNPRLVRRLAHEIGAVAPDLVHTHLLHADLHGQLAARAKRVPALSSVHGSHPFYRRLPGRPAAWLAGHLARRTIAISQFVATMLDDTGLAPHDRVRLVYYGIDPASWTATPEERDAARHELSVADDDVVVGVASRLVAHKGHGMLIEAMGRARRDDPRLRLAVAGEGDLRPELEAAARRALPPDRVDFLGFVPDVRTFMAACDLMTFPSQPEFGEGFGFAALEAMAAGRALVAASTSSLPEVVGDAGVLVAHDDVDHLARAIVKLAQDPSLRAELGDAARRRATEVFTMDAMVDATLAVYDEVLAPA